MVTENIATESSNAAGVLTFGQTARVAKALVIGVANLQMAIPVADFAEPYSPVRYAPGGIGVEVAGVGANVAMALAHLGNEVKLLPLLGDDAVGAVVRTVLSGRHVTVEEAAAIDRSPRSVVEYDGEGSRRITTDLAGVRDAALPEGLVKARVDQSDLVVMTNIAPCRALLPIARRSTALIATDVHAIDDLHDEHNREFLANADVAFMSHERLPSKPGVWLRDLLAQYRLQVAVVGLGADGALMRKRSDNTNYWVEAPTVAVGNTAGGGDSLLAGFMHLYLETSNAVEALKGAVGFASASLNAKELALEPPNMSDVDRYRQQLFVSSVISGA